MAGGKKSPSRSRQPFDVENLENRRLFATVSIANFGAIANDGRDDSAAIKRAIGASSAGDTVFFPEGTYNLSSYLTFNSNRTYQGVVGKSVLKRATTDRDRSVQVVDRATDIKIDGLVFDGQGVKVENASNLTIENNIFQHMSGVYANNHALYIAGSLTGGNINKNRFEDIWIDNAVMAYNISYTNFTYNKFDSVHEGIHIINFNRYAKGVNVSYNCLNRVQRMGLEIQESPAHQFGGFDGLIVEGNRYTNPVNLERETFAYSIVSDKAINVVIRNNYASGPNSYPGLVYAFETAGIGTRIENNRVDGAFIGIILQNTVNAQVSGNKLYGTGRSIIPGHSAIASNVGSNTIAQNIPTGLAIPACPADAPPSTGGGGGTPIDPPIPPDPTPGNPPPTVPAPVIETTPPFLAGAALGSDRTSLTWTDPAKLEDGYQVYRSQDGVNFTAVNAELAANTKAFVDSALTASTSYYYRVRFFYNDATGNDLPGPWSNIVRVITLAVTSSGGGASGGTTGGTTGGGTTGGGTTGGTTGGGSTGGTTGGGSTGGGTTGGSTGGGPNTSPVGSSGTVSTGNTTKATGGVITSVPNGTTVGSSGTVSTSSYRVAPPVAPPAPVATNTGTPILTSRSTLIERDTFSTIPIML